MLPQPPPHSSAKCRAADFHKSNLRRSQPWPRDNFQRYFPVCCLDAKRGATMTVSFNLPARNAAASSKMIVYIAKNALDKYERTRDVLIPGMQRISTVKENPRRSSRRLYPFRTTWDRRNAWCGHNEANNSARKMTDAKSFIFVSGLLEGRQRPSVLLA